MQSLVALEASDAGHGARARIEQGLAGRTSAHSAERSAVHTWHLAQASASWVFALASACPLVECVHIVAVEVDAFLAWAAGTAVAIGLAARPPALADEVVVLATEPVEVLQIPAAEAVVLATGPVGHLQAFADEAGVAVVDPWLVRACSRACACACAYACAYGYAWDVVSRKEVSVRRRRGSVSDKIGPWIEF